MTRRFTLALLALGLSVPAALAGARLDPVMPAEGDPAPDAPTSTARTRVRSKSVLEKEQPAGLEVDVRSESKYKVYIQIRNRSRVTLDTYAAYPEEVAQGHYQPLYRLRPGQQFNLTGVIGGKSIWLGAIKRPGPDQWWRGSGWYKATRNSYIEFR